MTSKNPLEEVNPNSLDYLFNVPPEEMTDEQVDQIVLELRKDRERFLAEPEKRERPKKAAADLNLKLEDLDL